MDQTSNPRPHQRRLFWSIGLCSLAMLGACEMSAAADWPMINGDPANSRSSLDKTISVTNVGRLKPFLTLTAGGDVYSTPIVAGGSVYFTDSSGKITNADIKAGDINWTKTISEYVGVNNATVRGSPAFVDGMIIFGDRNGAHVVAIDAKTGAKKWVTQIDTNPAALITGSPIVVGDRLFVGVSSLEGTRFIADRNYKTTFRGSMVALDVHTGQMIWKRFTMPEGDGWAGGAVISVAASNPVKGLLYFGTDHHYTMPPAVMACLDASPNDWKNSCIPADMRASALTALDMKTGEVRWSFRGYGADVWEMACGPLPRVSFPFPETAAAGGKPTRVRYCPPVSDYLNWSFAGGSPQLFTTTIGGRSRDVVAMASKAGILWLVDADSGDVIWNTQVGPYSEPGGLTWGAAYDGQRLYVTLTNIDHVPYALAAGKDAGKLVAGGVWSALDPATGKILWQTGDPQNAADYAAPMVANGVVYGGSLAPTGDQMYAMDAATGEILWRFAAGGSIASHPALVDGRLYWGSGFGQFTGVPGNKLYIFSVDGR